MLTFKKLLTITRPGHLTLKELEGLGESTLINLLVKTNDLACLELDDIYPKALRDSGIIIKARVLSGFSTYTHSREVIEGVLVTLVDNGYIQGYHYKDLGVNFAVIADEILTYPTVRGTRGGGYGGFSYGE